MLLLTSEEQRKDESLCTMPDFIAYKTYVISIDMMIIWVNDIILTFTMCKLLVCLLPDQKIYLKAQPWCRQWNVGNQNFEDEQDQVSSHYV